jgi:hypothetical protein
MSEPTTPEVVITALQARQSEVAQYEANIAMFTGLLAGLPTVWPERLLPFRNSTNQHESINQVDDLKDVELLADLWFADECYKSIRTETLEKRKSEAILNTLSI